MCHRTCNLLVVVVIVVITIVVIVVVAGAGRIPGTPRKATSPGAKVPG